MQSERSTALKEAKIENSLLPGDTAGEYLTATSFSKRAMTPVLFWYFVDYDAQRLFFFASRNFAIAAAEARLNKITTLDAGPMMRAPTLA